MSQHLQHFFCQQLQIRIKSSRFIIQSMLRLYPKPFCRDRLGQRGRCFAFWARSEQITHRCADPKNTFVCVLLRYWGLECSTQNLVHAQWRSSCTSAHCAHDRSAIGGDWCRGHLSRNMFHHFPPTSGAHVPSSSTVLSQPVTPAWVWANMPGFRFTVVTLAEDSATSCYKRYLSLPDDAVWFWDPNHRSFVGHRLLSNHSRDLHLHQKWRDWHGLLAA